MTGATNQEQQRWQRLRTAFDRQVPCAAATPGCAEPGAAAPGVVAPGRPASDSGVQHEVEQLLAHLEVARERSEPDPADDAERRSPLFDSGHILSDRYRILSHLGSGGMGHVYSAMDLDLQVEVALKTLHAVSHDLGLAVQLLRREVRHSRRVMHPNVCRIYDIGYFTVGETRSAFLTMELLAGETLLAYLRRGECLSAATGLQLAQQMCAGLQAAHRQNIIHGDLKPQNIFLAPGPHLAILDFGLSRFARTNETAGELTRLCVGTLGYLAPERFSGEAASFASDIYSLGMILREISALIPAECEPVRATADALTRWRQAVEQCLHANPSVRPAHPLAVYEMLAGGQPSVTAVAPTGLRWTLLASLALVALCTLAAASRYELHRRPQPMEAVPHLQETHANGAVWQPGAKEYFATAETDLKRQTRLSVEGSVEALRKGLALDPDNPDAEALLARALTRKFELTKNPEALRDADGALAAASAASEQPGEELLLARGMLQRNHSQLGDAVATLKQAVALNHADGEAWKQLGMTFDRGGNVLDAQYAFEQGLAVDPGNWSLYADFGLFYYNHGQFSLAEMQILRAKSLAPDNPAVFADLGGLYLAEGRLDDAEQTFLHALDLEPTAPVSANLGSLLLRRGKTAEAVKMYRKACQLSPDDYRMWTNLGSGLSQMGDKAEATRAYERATAILARLLSITPSDPKLLGQFSLYAAMQGKAVDARAAEAKCLAIAPEDAAVRVQAAVVEELLGSRATALGQLEKALELGASLQEIGSNPQLAALRGDPAFSKLTQPWKVSIIVAK